MPYLNVLVYKTPNEFKSDMYHKPTDNRDYLHFDSCHPHHTKTNTPFTLAKTICTIVDDPEICSKRLNELKDSLR